MKGWFNSVLGLQDLYWSVPLRACCRSGLNLAFPRCSVLGTSRQGFTKALAASRKLPASGTVGGRDRRVSTNPLGLVPSHNLAEFSLAGNALDRRTRGASFQFCTSIQGIYVSFIILSANAISDGDKESECDEDGPSPEDSRKVTGTH